MTISPEILRRIAGLPKSVIAEVLVIISMLSAETGAEFRAEDCGISTEFQRKEVRKSKDRLRKRLRNSAEKGEGGLSLSSNGLSPSLEGRKVESEGSSISKDSLRVLRARGISEALARLKAVYPKWENPLATEKKLAIVLRKGVGIDLIIDAAKRYSESKKDTDQKYIKAPDVWLNKGCWDDELTPVTRPNGHQEVGACPKWEQRSDGWWRDGAPVNKDGTSRLGPSE